MDEGALLCVDSPEAQRVRILLVRTDFCHKHAEGLGRVIGVKAGKQVGRGKRRQFELLSSGVTWDYPENSRSSIPVTPLVTACFATSRPAEKYSCAAWLVADSPFWGEENGVISTGSDVFRKGDKKTWRDMLVVDVKGRPWVDRQAGISDISI